MTTLRFLLAALLLLTVAVSITSAEDAPARPSIVWIMLDDCRADAFSCYGQPWARTPHADRLAAQGVRFDVAVVQNPVCVPSRHSINASCYCFEHGIMAMGRPAEKPPTYMAGDLVKPPCLLDRWAALGIQPTNVGKIHAYRQSWDHRGDGQVMVGVSGQLRTPELAKRVAESPLTKKYPPVMTKTHHWQIGGVVPLKPEETTTWQLGDLAVKTLEELTAKDEPFFFRASFHAPHVACRVPEEYLIDPASVKLPLPTEEELRSKPKFEQGPLHVYAGGLDLTPEQIQLARGTYYGMVWLVDEQIGRIVKTLDQAGRLDDTIIVITSDQGFQLGEHGLWKKRVFYDQNVRVPLIFYYPKGLPKGKVIDEPVELVDMVPTLAELTDVEMPEGLRGQSLLPLIKGEVDSIRPAVISEIDHASSMYDELRQGTGRRLMVRTRDWKLVFFMDDRVEDEDGCLYDLKTDPGETRNLWNQPEYQEKVAELKELARERVRPM